MQGADRGALSIKKPALQHGLLNGKKSCFRVRSNVVTDGFFELNEGSEAALLRSALFFRGCEIRHFV